MASTTTPEPRWVLVYDWSERMISRIPLDRLRENTYQVFPIPRPSYELEIYGLPIDLSSHRDFEEIHVINTPPGFSDTGYQSHPSTPITSLRHRLHASTPRMTSIQRSYAPSSYQSSYTPNMNITIPDIMSPDMTIPDITIPDSTTPDSTIPDIIIPDSTIPGSTIPDSTIPDSTLPDITTPDSTIPDITTPDSTMSSALPQKSVSNIPSTSELGSSGARLGSSIPSHDFHGSNTQSTSDLMKPSPDTLQAIREVIIRAYPSPTGWYNAAFTVRWELDQYLETELDFDPKTYELGILESVLTITGTGSAAYATTARSYIRWEWPYSSVDLLRRLGDWVCEHGPYYEQATFVTPVLGSPTSFALTRFGLVNNSSWSFRLIVRNADPKGRPGGVTSTRMRSTGSENVWSTAQFIVNGSQGLMLSVAQQLAWLTAVFRKPHYGQTSYSEVVFNEINADAGNASKEFEIRPLGLRKVHRSLKTCWLDLFSNCVIASGFPIPKRSNGEKGIELPYGIMTSQAGTLFSKTYKGGLFLRGLSTLIYPTASWENHQSVQWHIFDSGTSHERLPPGTIPTSPDKVRSSNWVRCTRLEKLALAPRTFLGYCKNINIYLATENSEISRVTYSQAEWESHRPALLLDSLAGGTSGMGIVSAQTNIRFVRPKGLVRCSMHDTLPGLLDSAQLRPLLVYDDHPEAQKGWLVPTVSVILHMAHVWAQGKHLLNKIPYVSPCWNAEEMAMRLIQEHGGLPLRRKRDEMAMSLIPESWGPRELRLLEERRNEHECLRDVVQKLLISLEELIVEEALAEKDPDPTISFESTKVYGWDLVSVAKLSLTCRRKQLSIHESWTVLSNEVLTLFCQGLGEVIRPASYSNICSTWNPIPSERHYLTATVPCLRQLSLQYGRASTSQCLRLSRNGYWHWPSNGLFDDCDCDADSMSTSNTHKCVKVPQQISRTDVDTNNDQHLPTQGAVIFGTRQLRRIAPANRLSAHRATNLEDSSNGHERPGSSHELSNQNTGRSSFRAIKSALLKKLL